MMLPSLQKSPFLRRRIESAMWEIEFNSCVRFIEKITDSVHDYVVFVGEMQHCYSDIGRRGGIQIASLGHGCATRGNVLHELLHTVGLWHTIARMDRNRHVTVLWDNLDVSIYILNTFYFIFINMN